MAVRTPLATAYPFAAVLLFLWVVADTLMLSLIARSAGKPAWSAVLGVLAGASLTVWLGSPPAMRDVLLETPLLLVTMAAVVLGHVACAAAQARQAMVMRGDDRKKRSFSATKPSTIHTNTSASPQRLDQL